MPDPEQAPDLYEELPDVDPGDVTGTDAAAAAEKMHAEVDDIAETPTRVVSGTESAAPEPTKVPDRPRRPTDADVSRNGSRNGVAERGRGYAAPVSGKPGS